MKRVALLLCVCCMTAQASASEGSFTGNVWRTLSLQDKIKLISYFKTKAREEGIRIKKGASYYSELLDNFYEKHSERRKDRVNLVLKTLIIMEYDWRENGVDKDALAREWLGEKVYRSNKKRFER